MMVIEKALKADAEKLAEIQKASFDEESKQFNNSEIGGLLDMIPQSGKRI
ncbi:hypothetical protein HMSSN036_23020 [Paenibacillus macerans]|nr:hypothetical protein HMSSN036_23020 [Paenibacillus macerans]